MNDRESRTHDPAALLTGQHALVTGAGRRLGREIALTLGDAGVNVAVHYNRSLEDAEGVRAELEVRGVRACTIQGDLADAAGLPSLLERAWEWSGGLDILVNNASIFPEGRLADVSFQDLTVNLAVNAWAPLALTRSLWRLANQSGGQSSVVNLLDSRLIGGDPLHAAYFLSKASLSEITRMAALEFAPAVRVNGVAPGPILSPEGKDTEYLRQRVEALPLRRWGGPEQIAQAVLYLSAAPFVTGQILFVDGGQHLQPWGPR